MNGAIAFAYTLADETRWRIALLILDRSLCVCELEDALNIRQSTLSSHLTVFRGAGMVEVTRTEKWAFYRLAPGAAELVIAMRDHYPPAKDEAKLYQQDRRRAAERVALRGRTDCRNPRNRPIPPVRTESPAVACC